MTPITSPPRLASLRTLTQVRATAGVHVMLSTAPATGAARRSWSLVGTAVAESLASTGTRGDGITPSLVRGEEMTANIKEMLDQPPEVKDKVIRLLQGK